MNNNHESADPQACHDFQQQLSELISSGQPLSDHPHVQTCENCKALIRDLETIAEAARQLLPIQQPEDNLWERIESAIKAEGGSMPAKADEDEESGEDRTQDPPKS